MSNGQGTDRHPIPFDPLQMIDELITRLGHFREYRRKVRLQDPSILMYAATDDDPGDEGAYIHPPMVRDANAGRFAFPTKRHLIGGTLQVYQKKFTNDGVNSGNHSVKLEPASGCPVEILHATVINGDTSARTCKIRILSAGGTELRVLASSSVSAAASEVFPAVLDTGGVKLPIDGDYQELQTDCLAVAVSQDSSHIIVYVYFGDTAPTITESYPAGCTVAAIA